MNNRGQGLGIAILTSIIFLIIGFMSVNFLFDEVDNARASLSCASASTISDGTKLLCLVTDITIVYFIIGILSVVIGGITSRFIF